MARFAVAYIEVRPDLSKFGAGLGKEIEARLGDVDVNENVERSLRPKFSGVGKTLADAIGDQTDENLKETVRKAIVSNIPKSTSSTVDLHIKEALVEAARLRAVLADLNTEKASPEVEVKTAEARAAIDLIRARLAHLRAEKAQIKIDVDRSALSHLGGAADDIGTAFRGIAVSVGGLLGVGGAITGLADAAAAALPIVAVLAVAIGALVASFGAAVAGAGALGIALAGALGPAAIVAFTALAKVAQIIKAIHDDGKDTGAGARSLVNAQDQLRSATEGLASAQANLKQQTTSAYQAWDDSIEAVKDDLLGVQDAQLGIEDASLSLKEAQLALRAFKNEAPGLEGIFKKFTDVDVDLSGLNKALDAAREGSGGKFSGEDQLKLERLILNVRRAKLGEKQATDRLDDAQVKLNRDQATALRYAQDGIRAYPGYASAVRGVASSQRQLAAAQRSVASSAKAAQTEVSKLSPVEQRLAKTFQLISTAFGRALGPAMNALLGGVNRGLRLFVDVLSDRRVIHALRDIGAAMGGVFASLAKTFSSPKFRDAFIDLSEGAASLVKILGTRVFASFAKVLLAIARAAMPELVRLSIDLADVFDRWAKWIDKHPAEFNQHIIDLITTFRQWVGVIVDITGFLLALGGTLKTIGDNTGRVFRAVKGAIVDFANALGDDTQTIIDFGEAVGRVVQGIPAAVLSALKGVSDAASSTSDFVFGLVDGAWRATWGKFRSIVSDGVKRTVRDLGAFVGAFAAIGKKLGNAFSGAFRKALGFLEGVAVSVINKVIKLIDKAIDGINEISPFKDIGKIDSLKTPKQRHDQKVIDRARRLPLLTPDRKLPSLTKTPHGIRASASASSDSAAPVKVIDVGGVSISAPAAAVPDAQSSALRFARLVDALG